MHRKFQTPADWSRKQIADAISEIGSGVSVNSDVRAASDKEFGVLKTSCVYTGRFRPEENKAVLPTEFSRVKEAVRAGCIIVSRMNTPDLVGASGYVETSKHSLFLPDRLWQVTTADDVDARWFSCVLGSPRYRSLLQAIATGTSQSMKNISQEAFSALPLLVPPIHEQRRIADILRTWNKAIEKTEQLIEGKQKCRDHLRHQLVGWTRWPKVPIGDVLKAVTRPIPTPTSAYKALSIRSHGKGTFHRLIERPEQIDMDTVYEVGARDLIVNITFAWEGAIALANPEDSGLYVSHRFPTFEVNEKAINRDFLGYAVRSRQFFHFLGIASPGGAGRNRVLNKNDFLEIEIPLPPKPEQDHAAKILLTADREITLLESKRYALDKQSRGLMEKLLTGEWRVTADA